MNTCTEMIMHASKGSEAADIIPQDPLDPPAGTRNNHFFALPLELRTVIYESYFSYENPRKTRTSHSSHSTNPSQTTPKTEPAPNPQPKRKFQSILARKLPLLWTNKAILAEALPVFYKCHTFRVHVPYWMRYEAWERRGWSYGYTRKSAKKRAVAKLQHIETLAPAGRFVTKLEVIETAWVVMDLWDERSIPGLQSVFYDFPNLKVLRLNVEDLWSISRVSRKLGEKGFLAEVWEYRLECLEICVFHRGDTAKLYV